MRVYPNYYKKFYHKNIYHKKFIKKIYQFGIKKLFFVYNINMQNLLQNSEIMYINNEVNLLQDLLKKNEKTQNQFQNGLMQIGRIRVKKGQRRNLSQTKKIQNIVKNIFQNKIEQIKKNTNLLQNILAHVKKRKRLFEKGLKKIAKMQNLSQNEFNQISEMRGQSRDELQ